MKKSKILAVVFAVMSAVSAARAEDTKIDFDGKKGVPMFSQLLAQAQLSPEAAGIPVRVFTQDDNSSMDKAIGSAIAFAKKQQKTELAAGFECLRNSGTPEQKAGFVFGANNSTYEFPSACAAWQQKTANKGLVDDGLQWLCESYNDVVEYLSCTKGPDGEEVCDVKLRTILRSSCHWG